MGEGVSIIELISIIIGGGGLTGFIVAMLTIRYSRRKAKGEAHSAEYEGMKVEQDTYQELIEDLREDRKRLKDDNTELQNYIEELKIERRQLREERDELRREIDELKKEMRDQGDKVARLGRIVGALKPLICSQIGCKNREGDIIGLVADDSFDTKETKKNDQD